MNRDAASAMTPGRPTQAWTSLALLLLACGCAASQDGGDGAGVRASGAVRISPDPAFASAQLAVSFIDPVFRPEDFQIEWRRNGQPIPGARARVLDPSFLKKGDRIEVLLSPAKSEAGPTAVLRAQVVVVNTPPRLGRVAILRTGGAGRVQLEATTESTDPDRDVLNYTYRWFRNGQLVPEATGASLPADLLAVGDQVEVEVVAGDGEVQSAPLRSEPWRLENRPPRFTSSPAKPGPKDEAFRYQAVAVDPDGDPLRYVLVDPPAGMEIGPGGAVSWVLPAGASRRGEYPVVIRAIDSKGDEGTQQFTISLDPPH